MKTHMATEDYLETILMLREENGVVRSVDIAEHLSVTKPSVTYATKKLREQGYIHMDADGQITLTEAGFALADGIYTRHKVLTEVLTQLGVPCDIAREDACKLEHDLSDESFSAICSYFQQTQ